MPYRVLGLLIAILVLTGCSWFISGEQQFRTEVVFQAQNYHGSYIPEGLRFGEIVLKNDQTVLWKEITVVKKHKKELELILKPSRAENWTIPPKGKIKFTRVGSDVLRITVPVVYKPTVIVLCDNVEGSFDTKTVYQDILALRQHGYPVFLYMTNGESAISSFDGPEAWKEMNNQSPTFLVNRVFDSYNDFLKTFAKPEFMAPEDDYYLHVLLSSRVYSSYKDILPDLSSRIDQTGKFNTVFYVPVNEFNTTRQGKTVDLRFVDLKSPSVLDTSKLR
jgi:hypothetical protein